MKLHILILLSFSFINCKGQTKGSDKEIFIGKNFYTGDELSNFMVNKTGNTNIDSISYSIYQSVNQKNLFIFSLEKFISNEDIELYKIIDTINIKGNVKRIKLIEADSLDYKNLNLFYEGKKRKSWSFPNYNSNSNTANNKWLGSYSLTVDYGKLDEFSEMQISYDIQVSENNCTFSGLGYKTYFTDSCKYIFNNDQLVLKYIKEIDGDGFSNYNTIDTLAIINLKNNLYYIKSPIIADKNWNYDRLIPLTKD